MKLKHKFIIFNYQLEFVFHNKIPKITYLNDISKYVIPRKYAIFNKNDEYYVLNFYFSNYFSIRIDKNKYKRYFYKHILLQTYYYDNPKI